MHTTLSYLKHPTYLMLAVTSVYPWMKDNMSGREKKDLTALAEGKVAVVGERVAELSVESITLTLCSRWRQ